MAVTGRLLPQHGWHAVIHAVRGGEQDLGGWRLGQMLA